MRAPKKILGAIAGVAMLATTLGIGSAAFAASPTYYDIYDLTTLAQNAANGLFTAGIMNGTAPGKFSPDGIVTRAQAVKFVVNLSGVQLQYPKTPSYTDVTAGSQYYPYIETALADGFLTGYAGSSGSFDPSAPVTRVDLAILVINAMGDQSVAQSMATDTTTYKQFIDLSKVPSGDLGYANAGMKLGFVPPLNATLYYPNGKVNREQLAVGLWRAYEALQVAAPASATVTSTPADVGVGQAATLSIAVMNKAGKALTASQLAGYTISYSVTGSNASSATVSANGLFVATAAGNYTVQASISGGVLSAPITATATVGVYGTPAALVVKPASASLVADGAATDTVTIAVVDANGNTVSDFNGTVDVSDSVANLLNSSGARVAELTGVAVTNGVASVTVQADTIVGETQTITAFDLVNGSGVATPATSGTATVSETEAVATQVAASVASGEPASLSANTASPTTVDVQLEDAAGNATSAGAYVTIAVTGPGNLNAPGGPTTETLFLSGTVATPVTIYSQTGTPGTITFTASSTGLTTGSVSVPTYITTAPASLKVASTSGTDANGEPYTTYTVQVLDTNGHPITSGAGSTDAITVSDNAAAQGGAITFGTLSSAGVFTAQAPPANLANGQATFTVETSSPGTSPVTITVDDTTSTLIATASYSFSTGSASQIAVSPASNAPYFETAPGYNVTVTAQLEDHAGNAVASAGQLVTFAFVATPPSGVTLPNGSASVAYVAPTNGQGVATATIQVPASAALGAFQVAATYGTNTAVDSVDVHVVSLTGYATQVVLGGTPTASVTAGNSVAGVTASPENALGGPVSTDVLQITTSNPAVLPVPTPDVAGGSTQTLAAGVTALPAFTAMMAGTATITVQDISNPSAPKATFNVTVVPSGTATSTPYVEYNGAQVSAGNPLNVTANVPVTLTVVNVDAGGNPVPVTGSTPLTVALSDTNGGGFRTTANGADVTEVQIPVGSASTSVFYVNPTTETITSGLTAHDVVGGAVTSAVLSGSTAATPATGSILVNSLSNSDKAASGTITYGTPTSTSGTGGAPASVTIEATTFTFNSSPTGTEFDTEAGLVSAINAQTGLGVTATSSGATISVVDNTGGTAGNSITFTSNDSTNLAVSGSGTFTGGTPPDTVTVNGVVFTDSTAGTATDYTSAANLTTAITADSANTGVSASLTGSTITLTATAAGAAGNSIGVTTNDTTDYTITAMHGGANAVPPTTLTITFNQPMNESTLTASNFATVLTPSSGHTFGTGASGAWTSTTTFAITLGTGATVAAGDTIAVASSVTDSTGGSITSPSPAVTG